MAKPARASVMKARLFDADRSDREVKLDPGTIKSIRDRQLLWVDLVRDEASGKTSMAKTPADRGTRDKRATPADSAAVLALLPFDAEAIEEMWASASTPRLTLQGGHFLARVVALRSRDNRDEAVVLDLAVGKNVVLTAHSDEVGFLTEVDARIRKDTTLGEIDSVGFATVLIDGLVTSYLELTDSILAEVDRLDRAALMQSRRRDLLADLVALRHRIASVRRVLVAHRPVIEAMAGADFKVVTGSSAASRLDALTARFDGAIGAIDAAREALLGTFDIHMSRTAQRTNDVVKILTIVSVLLLPAGVIAGFMGMNIKAPYSNDNPAIFWFVVAAIVTIAVAALLALRARKWL
jgi:magnesium transporter